MPPDTKDQILDAAEKLMAQGGYEATSLRSITTEAGVNLAAVNYHFGSKEELAKSVFRRRIEPVNQERLARLDGLSDAASVEEVLNAFVAPVIDQVDRLGPAGGPVKQLIGRIFAERPTFLRELMAEQFGDVAARFLAALAARLPELPTTELLWRFQFLVGALSHTMCHGDEMQHLTKGECDPDDGPALLRRTVAYAAAGLRAPVPAPERPAPERAAPRGDSPR